MKSCAICGSHSFNMALEGVNQGAFCDRHYWQRKAEALEAARATPALPQGVLDYGYSELFWAIAAAVEKTEPNVPRKISVRAFKEKLLSAPSDGVGSGTALPQAPLSGAQTADIIMAGLIHVGYTNPLQIGYGKESEGAFYSDTKNNCVIPLYMLKTHEHRLGYHSDAPAIKALAQGVEEWIADNWWCPIHNDEECDCGTGFVPADALEHYLSGMAIVPGEFIHVLQDAPEINPSNYDHDQVCRLNTAVNEALAMLTVAKEKS